jgi:alpha-galactosidase
VSDFIEVDEVELPDPDRASVYEHGWQSWSPVGLHRASGMSQRPAHAWQQSMRFRPETPPSAQGFQGEGLLAVDPGDGTALRLYTAPDPSVAVASIRAQVRDDTLLVTADGPVLTAPVPDRLEDALAKVGDKLGAEMGARLRTAPTVWCSWYHYFRDVTQDDIVENLEAIDSHDLPVDVVQVDDGWNAEVGDWLTLSERFTSLDRLAGRIRETGRRAGIWLAPFIAGAESDLARDHPDWLLGDAGHNWNQALHGLDLTHPGARGYLRHVFEDLRAHGYDYFKLDFLYGGALPGERHGAQTPVEAYRTGLELIRDAIGPESYVDGCGAPILPSIGRVDAMRVSSDTYDPTDADNGTDVLRGQPSIEARAWQQGRLWVNDPDCLVARPQFARREAWASVIRRYGGLRSVSDRIRDLDEWGLETTRQVLSTAPPPTPFTTLPDLTPR